MFLHSLHFKLILGSIQKNSMKKIVMRHLKIKSWLHLTGRQAKQVDWKMKCMSKYAFCMLITLYQISFFHYLKQRSYLCWHSVYFLVCDIFHFLMMLFNHKSMSEGEILQSCLIPILPLFFWHNRCLVSTETLLSTISIDFLIDEYQVFRLSSIIFIMKTSLMQLLHFLN